MHALGELFVIVIPTFLLRVRMAIVIKKQDAGWTQEGIPSSPIALNSRLLFLHAFQGPLHRLHGGHFILHQIARNRFAITTWMIRIKHITEKDCTNCI